MSELTDLLGAHEEEITRVLAEDLQQAGCPKLGQAPAGHAAAIVAALGACCQGNDGAARDWAKALCDEAAGVGLSALEVLAGLSRLERVVRLQVLKAVSQKKVLLEVLDELGGAVDLLRQLYVDAHAPDPPSAIHSAEDLAALADAVDVCICLANFQGRPLYVNPAGRRLLGLEADRPGPFATLHDYYAEESWQQIRDVAVPAVKETGRWEGLSRLRNAQTGRVLDVLTTMLLVRRIYSGKPSCLAIVHRDASELVRLETALTEAQARKHAILESALDPIITIDQHGVITEFNRAAEQTFGHPRSEVLGTKPSEILFPPNASAEEQGRIDRYLDSGEGSMLGRRMEVTAVRASGETFPAEMAMTISHEQGAAVLTFFVRDISQRKKAEEEQARYAAELERSNRELEQFAYVASHDLQEPLRKIRTFSDRLEMKCGEVLDETGRECVQRMQDAAGRMQLLIEGLLTLSRVTTRGQDFVPVDLVGIAREVVSDLESQIDRAHGQVEIGSLPTIQADPLQMRQLLQNLIGNALKFHRVGDPPVVKVHGGYLRSRAQRRAEPTAAEQCHFIVEDNGIGFDEKYAERIFGIFQRLHPREVYEGTGIGLPICRRIVERHGGTITACSAPGHGTTFEVVLPVRHARREET